MNSKKAIFALLLSILVVFSCLSAPIARSGISPAWRDYIPSRPAALLNNDEDEDEDDEEDDDEYYDPRLHIPDSVLASWPVDSLAAYADSLLSLNPIDSIRIDEALIPSEVADSIQAVVDSVYRQIFIKDSTARAKAEFQRWFDSIPKKEQKKWILENVTIPKQRRKADSLYHVKDSIKAYRDSVIEATPRILETSFIPDSLWYKRILLLKQDKYFSEFRNMPFDTSYNYHFYDYWFFKEDVNATWLGVAGGPTQYYNADKRKEEANAIFYSAIRPWSYDSSELPLYNTKTPHTELAYWGTLFGSVKQEEINLRFLTTQNITPRLNATIELNKWGAGGQMTNQKTASYHLGVGVNYLGKRYAAHAGWMHDHVTANENGGFVRLSDIRDTTLNAGELEVNLNEASSNLLRETAFISHNLRIPLGKDSLTTAFVGHTTEFTMYKRTYSDNISNSYGRNFYNDVFNINPNKSNDTLGVMKLDNRIFLKLQPWKEDFFISKINVGVGDKLLRYLDCSLDSENKPLLSKVWENNIYAYAGINGRVKKYFNWSADARVSFAGREAGDFEVNAGGTFSFYPFRRARKSPISLGVDFHTDLTAPDHYHEKILLNHYSWENSFKKRSTTRIAGRLDIPRWKLDAEVAYNIYANNIYFDNMGIVQQSDHAVNVLSAYLRKEFVVWKLHFDHRLLFQFSSDQVVMPVPMVALNLRYFLQLDAVKNVLQIQIGANGTWNTRWNLPAYNPELGVFYNQDSMALGNCPMIDVFVNLQWKRACIFLKVENVGDGWPLKKGKDYFTSYGYIHTQRGFKLGIFWPFYVQPARGGKSGGHDHAPRGGASGRNPGGSGMSSMGGFGASGKGSMSGAGSRR